MDQVGTSQVTTQDNGSMTIGEMPERICARVCELAAERGLSVEALMESLLAAAPRALDAGAASRPPVHHRVSAARVVDMVRENRASGGLV